MPEGCSVASHQAGSLFILTASVPGPGLGIKAGAPLCCIFVRSATRYAQLLQEKKRVQRNM